MENDNELKNISLDDIIEPQDQVRTTIVFEGLRGLSESIKQHGIIQPLIVLVRGEKYEIIAGHRRFLAAKMVSLSLVPCIVRGADVRQADIMKLQENSWREDVNPVDEGKFFQMLHVKRELAYSEIASLANRSAGYVMNRVSLLEGDPQILAALEAGQVNFSQAVEITKASRAGIRQELLRVTIENGATVQSIRIMRHTYEQEAPEGEPVPPAEMPEPGSYQEVKHFIECPVCTGKFEVKDLHPISICKKCYDGFFEGLKQSEPNRRNT